MGRRTKEQSEWVRPPLARPHNYSNLHSTESLERRLLLSQAVSGLQAYDAFDYSSGIHELANENGGSGWNSPWDAGINDIIRPGLTFGKNGAALTVAGNTAQTNSVAANFRDLPSILNSGTEYISFLSRLGQGTGGTGYAGISLFNTSTENLFIGQASGKSAWGLVQSTGVQTSTVPVDGTTHLFVTQIEFGAGAAGNDHVNLYIDPTPGLTAPDVAPAISADTTRSASFNRIRIQSGGGAVVQFDELRIGTTFASDVPAPAINGLNINARAFNDYPDSTLNITNNYPSRVEIRDQFNTIHFGFANRHDAHLSADGGNTALTFNNNQSFDVSADVTLTVGQNSPRKEAGIRVDSNVEGDGLFIIDSDAGEILAFGGPLPFYQFGDNTMANGYTPGQAINLRMIYDADTHAIEYQVKENGQLQSSGPLPFKDLENGVVDGSTVGFYAQFSPGAAGDFGDASFANITVSFALESPLLPVVPIPAKAPPLSTFPAPSSLYTPSLDMFLVNHLGEFSPDTRQFLTANSTPQTTRGNLSWKQVATAAGTAISQVAALTDLVVSGTGFEDAVTWIAIDLVPEKYQTVAWGGSVAAALAADFLFKDDPVLDLVDANAFIWGDLVAPQLVSLGQDPYDPNYAAPVVPQNAPTLAPTTFTDPTAAALAREFIAAFQSASFLAAATTAYNRYSSALHNSDALSATLQLESLIMYLNEFRTAVAAGASYAAIANTALANSSVGTTASSASALQDLQNEVNTQGLPPMVTALLRSSGIPEQSIDQTKANILAINPNTGAGTRSSILAQLQDAITPLPGDVNHDGSIGFADLLIVAQHYGTATGATYETGDINGDGAVSFADLLLLAQNYGLPGNGATTQITAASPATGLAADLVRRVTPYRR